MVKYYLEPKEEEVEEMNTRSPLLRVLSWVLVLTLLTGQISVVAEAKGRIQVETAEFAESIFSRHEELSDTTFTITFSVVGDTTVIPPQQTAIGDAITLPSSANHHVVGWKFAGWIDQPVSDTETKPLFYLPGAQYIAASDVTLYALYTRTVTDPDTPSNKYELFTEELTSGQYLLVYQGKAIRASVTSSIFRYIAVSPVDNVIETTNAELVWKLRNEVIDGESYWYLYNEEVESYAGTLMLGRPALYLDCREEARWTVTEGNGTCDFQNAADGGMLRYKTPGFTTVTTATGGPLSLYRNVPSTIVTYSTTPTIAPLCTHNFEHTVQTTPPTCTEDGIEMEYCDNCGALLHSTVLPALGHTPADQYSYDNLGHWRLCTVCGELAGNKEAHTWDEGTVTTPPTLTEEGVMTYRCTVCSMTKTETIPCPEHYTVTFSANGNTTELSPVHVLPNGTITLPTEVSQPSAAGWYFTGWSETLIEGTWSRPTFYLPGDSYTVTSNVTLYAVYRYEEDWPFLINGGTPFYERCYGELEEGDYLVVSGTKALRAVLILDHLGCESVTVNRDVIREPGALQIWHLSSERVNGVLYWRMYNATDDSYAGCDAYADGALWPEVRDETRWTVTMENNRYDFRNKYCGKLLRFSGGGFTLCEDAAGEPLTLYKYHEPKKIGYATTPGQIQCDHNYWWNKYTTAPTCTEDGYTEYYCDNCGEWMETTVIPATGHTPADQYSNDNLGHWRLCTVCGEPAEEPEAHTWDEGTVTTPPTITEEGVMTYACTVCEKTRIEPIEPLPYYTVSFSVLGDADLMAPVKCAVGEGVYLPLEVSQTAAPWSFVGWIGQVLYETTTATQYYAPGAYFIPEGDVTLYALYSKSRLAPPDTPSSEYALFTGEPTPGRYLLVYNGKAMRASVIGDGFNYSSVAASNDRITTTNDALAWDLISETVDGDQYWRLYSENASAYAGTLKLGSAALFPDFTAEARWTITSGGGTYDFQNAVDGGWLRYKTIGFTTTDAATGGPLSLYKNVPATIVTYSTNPGTPAPCTHNCWHSLYTTRPTCTEDGFEREYCDDCGALLRSTVLPALGHTPGDQYDYDDERHWRLCTVCGEPTEDGEAHIWDEGTVTTPPTLTEEGVRTYACTVCDQTRTQTIPCPEHYTITFSVFGDTEIVSSMVCPVNETVTLPVPEEPSGFSFCGWITEPSYHGMSRPNEVVPDPYIVTDNITLYGLFTYIAPEFIPYSLIKMTPGDKLVSGDRLVIEAYQTGIALYQETWQTSYVKNYSFTENASAVAADERNWLTVTAASGTDTWYLGDPDVGYLYCSGGYNLAVSSSKTAFVLETSGDGYLLKSTNGRYLSCRTDMTGNYNSLWRMGGTTTAVGTTKLTFYKLMGGDDCLFYTTYQPELHVHTPGAPVMENEIPATCTTPGSGSEIVYCSSCGKKLSSEMITIPALGHDYSELWEETEPTCTEMGYTTYTCSRCGNSYIDDEIPALGHDWGQWSETTAPTCTEDGEETRTCARCGEMETRPVARTEHDYEAVVTGPTCTGKGFTTYTCANCGHSYIDDETAPLGHDPEAAVVENNVEPGCTTAGGYDIVIRCGRCHSELSRVHAVVNALGHDWSEWTESVTPSCTAAGEQSRTCSRCSETETRPVIALGHLPGDPIRENYVEPTETAEGGYDTVVYCQRCNAEISREHNTLPPTGPVEPIETSDLHIYSSISVGTDMIVTFSARKTDVEGYERFWIEVVKHGTEGDETYVYEELSEGATSCSCDFNHIYAKEIGTEIEARVCAEDASGQIYMSPAKTTCIRDYLGGRLTATNNTVEQRVLAADMLNYSAAAQMFTDYQTNHLVNQELTSAQLAKLHQYETATLPAVNKTNTNTTPAGQSNILFNSVTLGNEVVLTLAVRASADAEVKVLVKDHSTGDVLYTLDTAYSGSSHKADFTGIGADKMRVEYDFVAQVNGTETGNIRTWSIEGYVGEIRAGNNQLKTDLANALLTYGDAAAAYFAS